MAVFLFDVCILFYFRHACSTCLFWLGDYRHSCGVYYRNILVFRLTSLIFCGYKLECGRLHHATNYRYPEDRHWPGGVRRCVPVSRRALSVRQGTSSHRKYSVSCRRRVCDRPGADVSLLLSASQTARLGGLFRRHIGGSAGLASGRHAGRAVRLFRAVQWVFPSSCAVSTADPRHWHRMQFAWYFTGD